MRLKNLLTVVTLCTLALATSVSAEHGGSCLRPGNNAGFNSGYGHGGWGAGGGHHGGWNDGGVIQVTGAFYGVNCGAGFRGNVTWDVQQACTGQQTCWYQVNHQMIGDPAYGCRKDFRVNYSCGDGQTRQAYLMGEASGQTLTLSCN